MKKLKVNWDSIGITTLLLYCAGLVISVILRIHYAFRLPVPNSVLILSWIFGWSFVCLIGSVILINIIYWTYRWLKLTFEIIEVEEK